MREKFEERFVRLSYVYADVSANSSSVVNKAARQLTKMCKYLHENIEDAKGLIDSIIESEHVCAKLWISSVAIEKNYRKEDAINMLEAIALRDDVGHLAVYAFLRLVDYGIRDWDYLYTLNKIKDSP